MVLLLILQSALTTKLVLCDHSEIYTPSNQTDSYVNEPITPGIAAILIFFGLVFTVFIGCWLKLFAEGCCELCKFVVGALKEQRNEREQVSKWTLNSNLNFTQISPNMNTGAVAINLYPVQQDTTANNAHLTQPPPARSDHFKELCFSEKLIFFAKWSFQLTAYNHLFDYELKRTFVLDQSQIYLQSKASLTQ